MTLREELFQGKLGLVFWGAGYIGYSDAAFYARQGIKCLLIDIDEEKNKVINEGEPPRPEIKTWLGFDVKPFKENIYATSNWRNSLNTYYPVHFICVNTERGEDPFDKALIDVCTKINEADPKPLVIVESTLVPGWTDSIIRRILGKQAQVVVAPRRDWFTLAGTSLENLDRVVGGVNKQSVEKGLEVLGIVSKKIHVASSHRVAEMVKSVENAIRHIGIAFAYQLALAFPNLNVREVLELSATKWNVDKYHPSIGIGGYCIPLAPKYVLMGAEYADELDILRVAMGTDRWMPLFVAGHLAGKEIGKVLILGVAYKGNLKVHIGSPAIKLAEALMSRGIEVSINDPLYSDEEIASLTEAKPVKFPEGIEGYDGIVIACDHDHYKAIPQNFFDLLSDCRLILDSFGIWRELRRGFANRGIEYHEIGDEGWIG